MTTNRFGLFCLASLLGTTLMSGVAFAQAAPPPQGYPDPNAQPQYPPPPQQYPQQQPGYPQQQQPGYAPQDYQQQQPGYPQQQQPGYPQQQPGYPPQQQPGYPQQQPGYPPPGGYAPPPGYGPPPGYAPAPPPAYAPAPNHHGLLAIAYIGINGFAGETGQGIDPGVRLGGLLGFYASPMFSLNGELSIDFLNLDSNSPIYAGLTGVRASLSIAPLFHFPTGTGNMELVVGPKLGVWDEEFTDDNNSGVTSSFSGYLLGLNAGAFAHVGRTSLGGLFSFESATPTKACSNDGFSGDICSSITGNPTSEKVFAFNLAALF
jgi:hypothetical protein